MYIVPKWFAYFSIPYPNINRSLVAFSQLLFCGPENVSALQENKQNRYKSFKERTANYEINGVSCLIITLSTCSYTAMCHLNTCKFRSEYYYY